MPKVEENKHDIQPWGGLQGVSEQARKPACPAHPQPPKITVGQCPTFFKSSSRAPADENVTKP